MCFGGEVRAGTCGVNGQPPGVAAAGQELMRDGEFALNGPRPIVAAAQRSLPLPRDPAERGRNLRRPCLREGSTDFHFRVPSFGQHTEELDDRRRAAVVHYHRTV